MPKPVDEDRARRKLLLEQKKAARKAAQKEAPPVDLASAEETNQSHEATETEQEHPQEQPLLRILPTDAFYAICAMLAAADLGRLWLAGETGITSAALQMDYLQRRWGLAQCLWHDAVAEEDKAKRRPPSQQQRLHETHLFLLLARFLEESSSSSNYSPGRIVSLSPEHSLLRLMSNGTVASWGVGRRGQLGHGARQDARVPRQVLYIPQRVTQVAAGGGLVRVAHSLLLTAEGRVFSFGTGQYGALGHGFSAAKQLPDVLRPTLIQALARECIVQVAAGELHSAAVTADGDVYTWGDGFCGQLGHGDKRPVTTPQQVTTGALADECVARIACGSRHTLAITEDGECFSWGLGHFGVLGRSFTPFEYDADAAVRTMAPPVVPAVVVEDVSSQPPPPRDMAAELAAHLDLIANLTLDDSSDQCIPKVIDALPGVRLVGASAGHRHSLLLDDQGHLYSFGAGSSGCLGHGTTESHMYPCRIEVTDNSAAPVTFRRMSAGVDMSMAVSTTGDVYAWGKTDGGRIGLGLAKSLVTSPRRVHLEDVTANSPSAPGMDPPDAPLFKAVDVECGYVHSIIVALNGSLWQCGGVGVEGENDGQQQEERIGTEESSDTATHLQALDGRPRRIPHIKVWKAMPEPQKEVVKKERWQKLGKYEVKGRSQMK